MNRRNTWLITILLLSVSLPLILLGISWFQNDKLKLQNRKQELFLLRIRNIKNEINQQTEKIGDEFNQLVDKISKDNIQQIRKSIRKAPSFKQIFIISEKRQVIFPPKDESLQTKSEKNTLKWLSAIKSEIFNYFQTPDENYSAKLFNKKNNQHSSTWFHFFQDEGINLILTKKVSNKIFGVRINMRKLQSEIIPIATKKRDWLKTSLIIISDASGKEIIRSGMEQSFNKKYYTSQDSLFKPLNSWKIESYVHSSDPVNSGEQTRIFFFITSVVMLFMIIIVITMIFIREHRKAVNEALRKVSFVNRISHELRTPLTNIRMYAELLEDIVEDNEKGERFLEVILEEAGRLMGIVENVLLFGRKERGVLKLNPVNFSLKSELDKTILFLDHQIRSSKLEIHLEIDTDIYLYADPNSLRQIFENLITNACKYSNGKLTITSTIKTDSNLLLSFTDNGAGIPPDDHKKIFEPFIRLSDHITEKNSGTGLGLTIAKELALKNDGDLYLTDYKNGAQFILKLPLIKKGDHN